MVRALYLSLLSLDASYSPAVRSLSLLTLILIQDIIVGEAELTSSPEEPEGDGEEGSGEDPGNMLLRAAKVLAAGGGSGGHSVTAGAADGAGGPAAVDGPPGGSSPGEGKRKRRSLGTAVVGGTGGTGGPGGMGSLLDDADAAEIDDAMQSLADGFLGASGELSGDGWTPTPPMDEGIGSTSDEAGTSGELSGSGTPPADVAEGTPGGTMDAGGTPAAGAGGTPCGRMAGGWQL